MQCSLRGREHLQWSRDAKPAAIDRLAASWQLAAGCFAEGWNLCMHQASWQKNKEGPKA